MSWRSKLYSFLQEHGFNLLYFVLLISANVMCLVIPLLFVLLLFFIAPITVYFMRRYNRLIPLAIPVIFGVIGTLTTRNNAYLYFLSIYIFASLGLYYALKMRVFLQAMLLSVSSIFISMILGMGICMIFAQKTDFVSIVQHEVLTTNSVYIKANAESYFNRAFPTEEDKALFRFPDDVTVPEGVDEEQFAVRHVYSVYVASVLKSNLLMYMVKLSVLLGAGGYLILGGFMRRLGGVKGNLPIKPEEVQLPKGFGLCSIVAVAVGYVLYLMWSYFLPVHLAVYHGMLLAPFAVYGVCFSVYLVRLVPYKALQTVLIGGIIVVASTAFFSEIMIFVFAILGLADYFVNFKKLIAMLFE